jgi:hypothetical protein
MSFGLNRGVDVPFTIGPHQLMVQIRTPEAGWASQQAYTFALLVDGERQPGDPPMRPIPAGQSTVKGIDLVAWASVGGAILGLSQRGRNLPIALLYVLAPAAVSWLARNTTWPTRRLWIVSIAILVGWIVVLAFVANALRS